VFVPILAIMPRTLVIIAVMVAIVIAFPRPTAAARSEQGQ
jgi:hypothetical protein